MQSRPRPLQPLNYNRNRGRATYSMSNLDFKFELFPQCLGVLFGFESTCNLGIQPTKEVGVREQHGPLNHMYTNARTYVHTHTYTERTGWLKRNVMIPKLPFCFDSFVYCKLCTAKYGSQDPYNVISEYESPP